MEFFEKEIKKQAHKSFVSMQMFCPACQAVLDHKKSASLDLFRGDQLVWSKIVCLPCLAKSIERHRETMKTAAGHRLEIYSGKTGETELNGPA